MTAIVDALVTAKTRTGTDVRKSVQRVFGDESGVSIEDADILMWINDAQDEIVNRNRVLKGTATTMSVIDQADYTLSPSIRVHQVESIHFNDRLLLNLPFAEAEQTLLYNAVSTMSGPPEVWYEWAGTFTFYPAPDTVSPIVLQYSLRPPRVTDLTSNLSLPEQYFQDIVKYVLQQAYELSENWQASGIKGDLFDFAQSNIDEEERESQHMTNLTIQVID